MNAKLLPYILILPVTLFLCVFFLYPFVLVGQQAFYSDGGFSLDSFREVVGYWKFPITLKNTLLLAAIVVPVQLALALLMATMVSKMEKGRDLVLYVWTIPLGISDLAAGLIWLAIFEQSGFLNTMMNSLGVIDKPANLLTYQNPWIVFVAIALAEIWRATAIMLVILVAGIRRSLWRLPLETLPQDHAADVAPIFANCTGASRYPCLRSFRGGRGPWWHALPSAYGSDV